jgi:hypothetical protein
MPVKKDVSIYGLLVKVCLPKKDGKSGACINRKIVSPQWIQLWFHVLDGQWDNELWMQLSDRDREYLGYVIHQAQIYSPDFEKALAKSFTKLYDRLRLVEESIKAGNLSQALVNEFESILDRFVASGQMTSIHKSKLKKRLNRTLQEAQ